MALPFLKIQSTEFGTIELFHGTSNVKVLLPHQAKAMTETYNSSSGIIIIQYQDPSATTTPYIELSGFPSNINVENFLKAHDGKEFIAQFYAPVHQSNVIKVRVRMEEMPSFDLNDPKRDLKLLILALG